MQADVIGHSIQGRPLVVHYRGSAACPRILIIAGQHGDEGAARDAAYAYLEASDARRLRAARVAVLADANPDGAAAGTRRNASGVDLNRDHLLLGSPETLAVHALVKRWRPDLIVDVHTYRPWRPELLRHGFVFPQDVMVDVPTNPAIRAGWPRDAGERLLGFVMRRMTEASLRCDRYTLVRPSGIVRHSNLDIVDARNGLALRYGVPTVLLEGRRSCPDDPPIFVPPHVALRLAIETVVEWAAGHASLLCPPAEDDAPDVIPARCQNVEWRSPTRRMEMQLADRGDIVVVDVPGQYLPSIRTTGTLRVPRAYGVPRSRVRLLEILARQGFERAGADRFRRAAVEVCRHACVFERDLPAGRAAARSGARLAVEEFVLFPTAQAGGRLLALLLDPDSQFSACRFPELERSPTSALASQIVRVV